MSDEQPAALESPEVPLRPILLTIGVGLVLTLVAIMALMAFYKSATHGGVQAARATPDPPPALETNLFRTAHSVYRPGPAPMGLDAAMAAVAAKGAHAYDPLSGGAR